jgi:hypothetical protein
VLKGAGISELKGAPPENGSEIPPSELSGPLLGPDGNEVDGGPIFIESPPEAGGIELMPLEPSFTGGREPVAGGAAGATDGGDGRSRCGRSRC